MSESLIQLPAPRFKSNTSIEEAICQRRTHRAYKKTPLTIKEISQLLFASQGITNKKEGRTIPSAGALYPLEVYLTVGNIKGILPGVYKYEPEAHQLIKILEGDKRKELLKATLFQFWIKEAPAVIILCGVFWRRTMKYRKRGETFVFMEAGHSAQNISLQAVSLGMGLACVGGFDKKRVKKILNLGKNETPLYLLPIGKIFKNYLKKEEEILKRFSRLLRSFLKNNPKHD